MPILASAAKRQRQAEKNRVRNVTVGTEIKTLRAKLFQAFDAAQKDAAGKLFREYCSVLDKSAKKGVISRNTAVRRKARAARRLKSLAAA
jgi:small subunit ribosomal protein S20